MTAAEPRVAVLEEGFAVLPGVLSPPEVQRLLEALQAGLRIEDSPESAVRHRAGAVYAARNVLELVPEIRRLALKPLVIDFVRSLLGEAAGLVRGLFFDKPPDRTWALPWHKDLSIAARVGAQASPLYSPVRMKAGVPHCEAPESVLSGMLTLRFHLDAATPENGPLQVWPGSHRTGKRIALDSGGPVVVLTGAGDVLAMRPLLAHCSGLSQPGGTAHRRVLHLEFASSRGLPDGYLWHAFDRLPD